METRRNGNLQTLVFTTYFFLVGIKKEIMVPEAGTKELYVIWGLMVIAGKQREFGCYFSGIFSAEIAEFILFFNL